MIIFYLFYFIIVIIAIIYLYQYFPTLSDGIKSLGYLEKIHILRPLP